MAVIDVVSWWNAAPAAMGMAAAGVAGAMAGSFLNVVAHRVPRRETVVFGRSRCPACGATIRARDNVPVLGWLALGGRCRDCGVAIPARYPLVEAACGGLAAVLAAIEVAANAHDPAAAATAWVGRAAVALTLVAWSLLAARGHAIGGVTAGVAALSAALAAAFVPALRPLAVGCTPAAWASTALWPGCLAASVTGLVAGWLGGAAAGGPLARAACGLVGAAGGWQAAVLATLATAVVRRFGRPAAAEPLAALAAVVCRHPVAWAWEAVCRVVSVG